MESLPNELKLQIFGHVQGTSTLSSLIHASPAIHAVYVAHRSEIFLDVTLRNLKAQGIVFDKPMHWAEVCVQSGKGASQILPQALRAVSDQIKSQSPIVLSIEECLALLEIVHVNTWVDEEDEPDGIVRVGMPAYPFDESPMVRIAFGKGHGEAYPCGVDDYILIFIEEMSAGQICWVKKFTASRHRQEGQAIEDGMFYMCADGISGFSLVKWITP